ncbi:MAG: hypothetical protein ACRC5M_07005 [Anaeroplasmataceae bacterium]
MSKILILCEASFLNNSSGINTFINHLTTMLSTDEKYSVHLIVDTNKSFSTKDIFINKNITIHIGNRNPLCKTETMDGQYEIVREFKRIIFGKFDKDDEIIFLANSFPTTIALVNLSKEFLNSKFYSYTHVGDVISSNIDNYDFETKIISEYRNALKNSSIISISQTSCTANELSKIIDKPVLVAPEPIYIYDEIDIDIKDDSILIICSNYKRKRFDIMLKFVGLMKKPVKILCGNENGFYDIKNLLIKHNITEYTIVEDIDNYNIGIHISMSKMLLHFSDIEVCPYSIIESASKIPCLINSNSEWGKNFPDDIVEKVDYNDEEAVMLKLNQIFSNKIVAKFNLQNYIINTKKIWDNIFSDTL